MGVDSLAGTNSEPIRNYELAEHSLQILRLAAATTTYHPMKWHSITPFMSVSRKKLRGAALLESVRRRLQNSTGED